MSNVSKEIKKWTDAMQKRTGLSLRGGAGVLLAVFLITHLSLLISSCARMGSPDGGWFDDKPPRIIGSTPLDRSTNVTAQKITILFDEYIKIEDATNKVIVSPPQLEMPEIKSAGKKIIVELKDSLKPNTTYTIDFSDAITDNNEGNPLGNYTYTFSTGEQIDTFEVSGTVLNAKDLEPVKGLMVGLYDDLSDSVFKTKPLQRVSRTDSRGHFVIKGVAPGTYRAYALQDADGDYVFNQLSENIAFSHQTFVPSSKPDIRQDTIWRDSLHIDSIMRIPYIHYFPDDIVLLSFQHEQTNRYLLKRERSEPNRIKMYFSYGNPEIPRVRGLNFNSDEAFIVEANAKHDTITYWLRDTMLVNQDTLRMELQYLISDSTGALVNHVDTFEALPKVSYEKRLKDKQKEIEKWLKDQEKNKKRGKAYDSIYKEKPLTPQWSNMSSMDPDKNVTVVFPTPLTRLDTAGIHLYTKVDSLWYRTPFEFAPKDSLPRTYELRAEWRPEMEYSLEIDSAAFEDIYGLVNDPFKQGIKIKSLDEYSTLFVQLSGADNNLLVVHLLNQSGDMVKETRPVDGTAEFYYVEPGKYFLSAFVDTNGNGVWDTGDYDADRQPEDVYYYPEVIECKAKWDVTERWNLTARPRNEQKPADITKQKGEQQKKLKNRNAERAEKLGIEIPEEYKR